MNDISLYYQISVVYTAINAIIASLILIYKKKSFVSQFYFLCIVFLIGFGVFSYLLELNISEDIKYVIERGIIFLYAIFPFFFLHFIIVYVGYNKKIKSTYVFILLYFTGLFTYTLVLLNLIPSPLTEGALSTNSYMFYIIWMSVFFTIGVSQLYALVGGNYGKTTKPKIIFTSFVLLFLLLPGPFSETVISAFFTKNDSVYYLASLLALSIAIYFVFRHKTSLTITDTLKLTMSVMKDIIINTDHNLNIQIVKGDLNSILGYTEKELIRKNLNEIFTSSELLKLNHSKIINGKVNNAIFDVELIKKDKSILPMSFSLTPIIDNEIINGYVCIGRDISDIRKAQGALKLSEERFKGIFDNSQIGIYQSTLEGKFIVCNAAFLKILGYNSIEELREIDINENIYVDKNDRVKFLEVLEKGNFVRGFETSVIHRSGRLSFIKEYGRLITNESGVKIIEGTIEDVTEKKIAEQEIIFAKEKAEQSDKLKTQFLAQMSHEIRTPINAIISFSGMLKSELEENIPDDLAENFSIIDKATKRIIRTIDLILDMSKLQSGMVETNFKMLDIYEKILLNIYYAYEQTAIDKNINFQIENRSADNLVFADEYTIGQVFTNLVDNAFKYTNNGSIEIILDGNDKELKVTVTDTGIGISKEYLPTLFDTFSQEDQTLTREYEGNGLGLALAKKYCEINKAKLDVKSEKNKGSDFIVSFQRLEQ